MSEYRISLCTVAMNRLHHVRETLPRNISDNCDYNDLEFVLLDYNSTDGLAEWVRAEMHEHLETGRLKYYRTEEPLFFDRTHSRNMAFRLATGNIFCNVDADNYTGKGYAHYINGAFNNDHGIFLVADTRKRYYFLRNAFGRFCCSRDAYHALGGMDESMKSYGSETLDLYERMELSGLKEVVIRNTNFLKAISHDDTERIENEFFLKNIKRFYIRFHSFMKSDILFLFKNGLYERCSIIREEIHTHLPAAVEDKTLELGAWTQDGDWIILNEKTQCRMQDNLLHEDDHTEPFFEMTELHFLQNVAKNYSFIINANKTMDRKKHTHTKVNNSPFGVGTVVLNFDRTLSTN